MGEDGTTRQQMTERARLTVHEGRRGVAMAVTGLSSVVLLAFLQALEDQIGRLRVPGEEEFGYSALHGDRAADALRTWKAGAKALATFHPVGPRGLLMGHVVFALITIGLLTAFALLVLRRAAPPDRYRKRLRGLIWILAGGAAVGALLDLWLVLRSDPSGLALLFKALAFLKITGVVVLVLVMALLRFDALSKARSAYRYSPATARLVLFTAVAFAGLLQFGDIGAQSEDLLRRELAGGAGSLLRLLIEMAVYLTVIVLVSRIRLPPAMPPNPKRLVIYGAVVAVVGGVLLWLGKMGGPLTLGVIMLIIGVGSALVADSAPDDPPAPPAEERTGRALYAAAALLPAASLAVLAGRLFSGELATHASLETLFLLAVVALLLLSGGAGVAWYCLQGRDTPVVSTDPSATFRASRWSRIVDHKWLAGTLLVMSLAPIAIGLLGLKVEFVPVLGRWLSSFGVLLVGITAFAATCGAARLLLADWDRPALIARLGLRTTPVVSLLLIWFVGATAITAGLEKPEKSPHVVAAMTWAPPGAAPCPDGIFPRRSPPPSPARTRPASSARSVPGCPPTPARLTPPAPPSRCRSCSSPPAAGA